LQQSNWPCALIDENTHHANPKEKLEMNATFIGMSKLACLALFGLGLTEAMWPDLLDLPFDAPLAAVLLLGIHALEVLFAFQHVRLYKGPLAISVVLTLLFGLLHWKPLAQASANDQHD
jgi:hypothetical protein